MRCRHCANELEILRRERGAHSHQVWLECPQCGRQSLLSTPLPVAEHQPLWQTPYAADLLSAFR
jgi:hypothetical protein